MIKRSGETKAQISRELGVSEQNVSRWWQKYGQDEDEPEEQTVSQEAFRAMQAELRRVKEERDILKNNREHFLPARVKRCEFIQEQEGEHAVKLLCEVMRIGRSGYYAWKRRKPGERVMEDTLMKSLMQPVLTESKHTYGSRRLKASLEKAGVNPSRQPYKPPDERRGNDTKTGI